MKLPSPRWVHHPLSTSVYLPTWKLPELLAFKNNCSITVVSVFPPSPSPTPTPKVNPCTVVHVHRHSFIHALWLVPSPSFHLYPPLPSHWPLSLFHVSMSLVLCCLLVYFGHYIPFISEIMWYLSFTTWLISLSIMLSRSIHAVVKGRSSFFLSAA